MKKIFLLAALALTMAACSNEDNMTDQPAEVRGIPFSATITTGGATRALSGPDNTTKVITATWAENEEVALVYEVSGETKVTKAIVKTVSDGTATINATLDENVTNGTNVTLIYPYSMVNTSGTNIGKLKADAFTGQNGALTGDGSISAKYDLRQGTGKITLATTPATLKDNVAMPSQIAIWKLTTKSGGSALNVTKFDVYFGGATASASIASGNAFYMAVPAGNTGLTFLATAADGTYIYSKADVTLAPSKYYESEVSLTKQTTRTIKSTDEEVTLADGDIVSGTGGGNTVLKIASGATVTLNGLTNNSITGNNKHAGIECNGDATIILADGSTNTLKGRWEMPAIFIPGDKTLTIRGGGELVADNSGASGAGIGGGYQDNGGNIVIEGGNITAKGSNGAGIGSGDNGKSCGTITISGGTITATGGGEAAGIGSGNNGACGVITISSGTVKATGGKWSAGIGSGSGGKCDNITISGGTVNATGDAYAAGIGSGLAGANPASCGNITIDGLADVTATGGAYAAGIGSGMAENSTNSCVNITISGSASVEASGGNNAAGIGSGYANNAMNVCGNITISGTASVKASGGFKAAGIGTSNSRDRTNYSKCGAIKISGGMVTATSGSQGAAGIGNGFYGHFDSLEITGDITSIKAVGDGDDNDLYLYHSSIGKYENGWTNADSGEGTTTVDGIQLTQVQLLGFEPASNPLPDFPHLNLVITTTNKSNDTWTFTRK